MLAAAARMTPMEDESWRPALKRTNFARRSIQELYPRKVKFGSFRSSHWKVKLTVFACTFIVRLHVAVSGLLSCLSFVKAPAFAVLYFVAVEFRCLTDSHR